MKSDHPKASESLRSSENRTQIKEIERVYICDRCGARMTERQCKIICHNCGHRFDCSDLNIHFD